MQSPVYYIVANVYLLSSFSTGRDSFWVLWDISGFSSVPRYDFVNAPGEGDGRDGGEDEREGHDDDVDEGGDDFG